MKKIMGFVAGLASVALAGTGIYLMMSKNTKKQLVKTMNSTLDDANQIMNKKMNLR